VCVVSGGKMDNRDQNIDFELIARYLSTESSDKEVQEFESWLNANLENQKIFGEYKKLWDQMGKVGSIAGLNLDTEWEKLEARMNESDSVPEIKVGDRYSRSVFIGRIAVAAVIVLALSFSFIFISRNSGSSTIITDNSTEHIILPDGSGVTLNANSSLNHQKRFRKDVREVRLEGEAFFEVERDESKPFIILIDGVQVKVLGTSFNVKAYKDNAQIEVTVSSGQVAFTKPGEIPRSIILKPGNKGVFSRSDHTLTISRDINRNYLAWKTRDFVFEDQTLMEVVHILNSVYNSRIIIASDSLEDARITSSFNEQTLDAILNVLSATLDFDVEKSNGQILLKEGI
jgi:transmembrane sensor